MNRDKQKEFTQRKIFNSALYIFSNHAYQNASINMICKYANISKGIVYHYYKDKDDLYMQCVNASINKYYGFISGLSFKKDTIEENILYYFEKRQDFLNQDQDLNRLFNRVLYEKPSHLVNLIEGQLQIVTNKNKDLLVEMLNGIKLINNLTTSDAVDYINMVFQSLQFYEYEIFKTGDEHKKVIEKINQMIKTICYGIIRR